MLLTSLNKDFTYLLITNSCLHNKGVIYRFCIIMTDPLRLEQVPYYSNTMFVQVFNVRSSLSTTQSIPIKQLVDPVPLEPMSTFFTS